MVSQGTSKAHIKQLLAEPKIQDKLANLLSYYYDEVHYISDIAASECQGIRPSGLENEVYACLHHIARGLAIQERDQAMEEIGKGCCTHLKRLHLDAYKIAINAFLTEYSELVGTIRFFVLEDTFKKVDQNGTMKAVAISDTAAEIKKMYLDAKRCESAGDFKQALNLFNDALTSCYDLRAKIRELTSNNLYSIALAYTEKQRQEKIQEKEKERQERLQEKKKDRRWDVFKIILTAIITLILSHFGTVFWHKLFADHSRPSNVIEQHVHGPAKTR